MLEAELTELVTELCDILVVHRYHNYDAVRSLPGWPDLVLWGPGGVIFRELKSDDGRLSTPQVWVIGTLQAAGADVAVWRPVDWVTNRIERELRRVAGWCAEG